METMLYGFFNAVIAAVIWWVFIEDVKQRKNKRPKR